MNTLTILNPADGDLIASLPTDDAERVARKAAAARAAQPAWASLPLSERIVCIERFRAAIVRDENSLARTLTREVGKPITQARNELRGLQPRIDFFLARIGQALASEIVFDEGGMREEIERLPLGVVANISAWNYPWFVGCNVILPALLAGNAVLYKPSEHASLTGQALTRLLHEAGVPPDVMACVLGAGETGRALLAQPVDAVCFTGSHATGLAVAHAARDRLVHLQLELGGKDPGYVCDDAPIDLAAASLAEGAMYNAGQSCCAIERIYVHERVHDAFVERFVDVVRKLRVGDPLDEATEVGPLARAAQLQVLQGQVADALARGATLRLGGGSGPGPGHWFQPTVLTDVTHEMEVMREESFGPVIGIQRVADDDEAVRLMNDTRYGLTASVYTPDGQRARRLLSRMAVGTVYWNCCDRVSPRLPWSGMGDSGLGLTLSLDGLRAFSRPRAWHLRG
ncbi:aldehyde dehydrogenase family protein [Ramlibacter sp. AW1]|uniref:Aldehyde dehydrogenase family protein n=1 Tax=Ramlibacter aurantiacus TaxID=2801330 RepID=A0A936ZNJ3_9BURK|nr:aldehyde dehydrogenase family protein [Ramlibacter aurantiacus]MBL0420916.1 aldehyde dehydrogenase family protein [Ramlibacter aurantiacus]